MIMSSTCPDLCGDLCSDKLKVSLATAAAGILFPLLVWGGYALLPFDPPLLQSAPLRVVYTLRCSFFAIIPILFGKDNLLEYQCLTAGHEKDNSR